MAAHAHLKNTEDEKCHNRISWLNISGSLCSSLESLLLFRSWCCHNETCINFNFLDSLYMVMSQRFDAVKISTFIKNNVNGVCVT